MDWVRTTAESLLASYSAMIQGVLAGFAERLADLTSYPFLVTPAHRLHWIYLFSYLVIALVIYLHGRRALGRFTLKGFLGFWLPSSVYRRRSTMLDLKYYVVNMVFMKVAAASTLIGSFYVFGEVVEAALRALWSAPVAEFEAAGPVQVAYGAALFLMADFGFFLGHYLAHKVPLLWEFHKVHHSAEVLSPLTNYRFHPIDTIGLGLFIGIFTGVVKGAFGFAYPGGIGGTGAVTVNVTVLLLFNLAANFRHSHVWLSYGWHLNHIFSSPAQHQIHHSTAAWHIDKKFGLTLSVWDWLVGSRYEPRRREGVEVGLTGGGQEGDTHLGGPNSWPAGWLGGGLFGRGDRQSGDPRLHGEM